MARGITETQVHAAADALVAAGERPTVERIRAHLGSGSPNTVTRLLDSWWAGLGPRLAALAPRVALPEAPDAVQRLAGELWAQAVAAARDQAEAALADERGALAQAHTALADAQVESAAAIAAATQAREVADQARILAEARLAEAQRRADQLEAQLGDVTEQRTTLAARVERLEQARTQLADLLQAERTVAAQEREAQTTHMRAVEDRAHAEVDRTRQDAQDLRTQLRAIARERGQEREALEMALKQARTELSAVQRELAKQTGRAEALQTQLVDLQARWGTPAAAKPRSAKTTAVPPKKAARPPRARSLA